MPKPLYLIRKLQRSYIFGPPTNPGPWQYQRSHYNAQHVICDAEGRLVARDVKPRCGPLLAAAPTLLNALRKIARIAPRNSEAREVAVAAIERHMEREGILLEAEPVGTQPIWREPRLPVVGVAT